MTVLESLPVLVLDDEIEIVKSVARDLRRHAIIETFTDAHEALESVRKKAYSVIISDLNMPKMSGLEFLGHCAALHPLSSRILLTAYADLANLKESVNRAQLSLLLTKPWEALDLQQAVESAQRNNELLRENAELRRLALTDALTGVSNHRYFWERLDSEFSRAQRYGRPLSLIMGDVDNFKQYNDKFGHQRGDEVLREVADGFELNKRSMDTIARYGGEEFAIILPEVTRPQAIEIAKRHLESISAQSGITLSFGVATFPEDAKSPTELVYCADQAMLKAKESGKSRVHSALGPT